MFVKYTHLSGNLTTVKMACVLIAIFTVQYLCAVTVHGAKADDKLPTLFADYFKNSQRTDKKVVAERNSVQPKTTQSLLSGLVRNGAVHLEADDMHKRNVMDVKRDEIYSHLMENGGLQTDFNKPSVGFMLQVFEQLLDGERLDQAVGHTDGQSRNEVLYSDTVRSFTAKRYRDKHAIVHVPPLPQHERVVMAEVRFLGNKNVNKRQRFVLLVRKNSKTVEKVKLKSEKSRGLIYLPETIISYINRFHGNVSIVLQNKSKRRQSSMAENAPILVIYSSDNGFMKSIYKSYTKADDNESESLNRSKRATNVQQLRKKVRRRRKNKWNDKETEPCQLHDFKVDFDLIGWGPWIIHPKTFNAHVCYGECPSPVGHEYSPTNHAMLQTLMRMKRPRSAPAPCCVPTKLRPLSMLYFEYDDIVVRHHEDMIAAECGCR